MNDWYLGCGQLGLPPRRHADARQVRRRGDPRPGAAVGGHGSHRTCPSRSLAHHAVDFWLCGEDLPLPESRVTLDRDGAHPPERSRRRTTAKESSAFATSFDGMLDDLGMQRHHLLDRSLYLHKSMPIGATAHQAGTVRFGRDPHTQRPRRELQGPRPGQPLRGRHSFFPSIGAVNPSLTAIANAMRVGDHLTDASPETAGHDRYSGAPGRHRRRRLRRAVRGRSSCAGRRWR